MEETTSTKINYYAILGLDYGATQEQIRQAHLRMARAWHPDKHGGCRQAEERFKLIQTAAEVLRDPETKQDYDLKQCIYMFNNEEYVQRLPGLSLTISGLGLCSKADSMFFRGLCEPNRKSDRHFLAAASSC
eukprot:CAMPEP_0177765984 /NCGR_PEP_ID=MMETSP0491_2-20121128/8278_1 /TAXON_ID=63592 /ORGANISM="Tetraselmis chuii, Strain PLY429" /LENGTH=131 /DNA_ID=CAMNT_0019282359 /DNA_START=144 /DNA_END=539 /DNA_ORIENTATION=-